MRIACLFCLSFYSGIFTADADVIEQVYTNHYFVTPLEGQTLQQAIYSHSPISRDGKVYYGQTQWSVSPGFRYKSKGNLCYLSDVEVQLKVKFMLPKLHLKSPQPEMEERFARFYQALQVHESGHQALGQQAAKAISDKLGKLGPHYDCRELANTVKAKVTDTIQFYKQQNSAYDQETQFGKTQGAVIR
jgi:predicted secreted Zn-dependent protease